ncbi:hypothetical protein GCM10009743_54130 [Kribbella swartbergensis]
MDANGRPSCRRPFGPVGIHPTAARRTLKRTSRPARRWDHPRKALAERFGRTEQAPGDPPPEPLGFPSERPRKRSGSLLPMTLGGGGATGKSRLSTPVDNPVGNLWDAPPATVDGRGNRV